MGYRGLGRIELDLDRYGLSGGRRRRGEIRGCERRGTGAKWRPAILLGGHHRACSAIAASAPERSPSSVRDTVASHRSGASARTGRNGPTSTSVPALTAIWPATTSPIWAASPPCLIGTLVVAGRVDVFEPVHAAVVVDRDEPVRPLGSPSIPGSRILGRVTTRSTTSRPAGELSSPPRRGRKGSGEGGDPSLSTQRSPIGSLAWGPNSSEWRRRGRQHQLDPVHTLSRKARRGQQGELVERQRPWTSLGRASTLLTQPPSRSSSRSENRSPVPGRRR